MSGNQTPEQLHKMGMRYRDGDGVTQDIQKALEYFTKAVDQGYVNACIDIGALYATGHGVPIDFNKAAEWYLKAPNNVFGQYNMGLMYRDGQGVPQDYHKSLECFTKSADQGFSDALSDIGFFYENGFGVPLDYNKAMEYYTKAANAGSAIGLNNLGALYLDGKGVPIDYQKAFEYCTKAANLGNIYGLKNLGTLYEHGHGVLQDYQKAAGYYIQAHNKGHSTALELHNRCQDELRKIEAVRKTKNVEDWNVNEVHYWLKSIKLSQDYGSLLQTNSVDGRVLLTMNSSDDWKELGITNFGDLRILKITPNPLVSRQPTSPAPSITPAHSPTPTAGALVGRKIKGKQSERSQLLEGLEEVTYKPIIKLVDNFTTQYNCRQHMLMDFPSILPDPDVIPDLVEECLCVSESCLQHLPDGVPRLSADEALAIAGFTFDLEVDDINKNLYYVLNKVLRERDPPHDCNFEAPPSGSDRLPGSSQLGSKACGRKVPQRYHHPLVGVY